MAELVMKLEELQEFELNCCLILATSSWYSFSQ
jgi:hypothetical protein